MRSNRSTAACTAASASAGLVTSSLTTCRSSWAPPRARSTASGRRPVATTALPAASAALAMSTPIPRPAPVTIQTFLSVSGIDILLYGWVLHARQYHPRYSPECVEGEFCELRIDGVLGRSRLRLSARGRASDRQLRGGLMELRSLGHTGVSVSQFCLGAMMFGAWGNTDHDESIRIIHRALDAGINFIDTADVYGAGESEQIVGKALAGGRRDDIVLATKFHNPMGEDPNERGNSRRWIMRAVEDSLRRLGTDWIDLYQVHRPDPGTDIEETLGALTDLVHQGKVRYLGGSTFPASAIVEAQWAARERGLQRFVTEQPPYSILVRAIEADVLPTCARYGMGVMSYSPLTGGWLSGRWRKSSAQQSSSRAGRLPERFDLSQPGNQRKLDAVERLAQLAEQSGITLIQLAIAFVLNHPAITSAIVGPRTMEQLQGQLAAADAVLDAGVLDRIDEIVAPGTTVNPVDNSFANPALVPGVRRRFG